MPKYTLKYFPFKAIAEGARLLLTYGNADFEDVIISVEDWPKVKPTLPFGVVPVLEIDGKQFNQSVAMGRYLGKQFGLAGDNDLEAFEIDQIVDTINDFRMKVGLNFYEPDGPAKEAKHKELSETVIPFYIEKLDALAAENNGHLAAGKLTWADFFFAGAFDYFKAITRLNLDEKAPNLKRVVDNVLKLPELQKYLETAEKYPY